MGDVEDIKPTLDMACLEKKCQKQVTDYNRCLERIKTIPESKGPNCFGWYFEIIHCVDHCAAHDLWHHLK